MRSTIIPAQITTVEDKIVGNLSFSQLMLFMVPLFGGCGIYIVFPPFLKFALYKAIVVGILTFFFCLMAIRVRGKILLDWASVIIRYNVRPRYYLLNKNSLYAREEPITVIEDEEEIMETIPVTKPVPSLEIAYRAQIEEFLRSTNVSYLVSQQGGIRVIVPENK